ncbi:hypothetical protein QJS66_22150 [Kocuria rhizophila]|nr:hypothetical protein QJS66_22150 [Kocuria rhizophila]
MTSSTDPDPPDAVRRPPSAESRGAAPQPAPAPHLRPALPGPAPRGAGRLHRTDRGVAASRRSSWRASTRSRNLGPQSPRVRLPPHRPGRPVELGRGLQAADRRSAVITGSSPVSWEPRTAVPWTWAPTPWASDRCPRAAPEPLGGPGHRLPVLRAARPCHGAAGFRGAAGGLRRPGLLEAANAALVQPARRSPLPWSWWAPLWAAAGTGSPARLRGRRRGGRGGPRPAARGGHRRGDPGERPSTPRTRDPGGRRRVPFCGPPPVPRRHPDHDLQGDHCRSEGVSRSPATEPSGSEGSPGAASTTAVVAPATELAKDVRTVARCLGGPHCAVRGWRPWWLAVLLVYGLSRVWGWAVSRGRRPAGRAVGRQAPWAT